jgi:hypothetical protein
MNTKAIFAAISILSVPTAPSFLSQASAKINPAIIQERCGNPAEQDPPGQNN